MDRGGALIWPRLNSPRRISEGKATDVYNFGNHRRDPIDHAHRTKQSRLGRQKPIAGHQQSPMACLQHRRPNLSKPARLH